MSPRHAFVLSLSLGLLLVGAAAHATHCADPADRPAVCTVDAYAGLAGERSRSFDLDGSVEVQPGQTLEIELDAFDQNRRRFPKDRLAFDVDANDCRHLAKVEATAADRIEITAGDAHGECELWIWVPGNLNLEWQLDVAVAPRARAGYSASEAEFITQRLYQALLRREADPQGLRDTSAMILRGDLGRRIDEILRSEEYRTKARGAHPAWLLEQLYLGIFDRKPDSTAVQAFSRKVESGQIAEVVRELIASAEFEQRLLQH